MKQCSKCKIVKPYSDYNRDASKPDGFYSSCKPCKLMKDYEWGKRNPEKVAAIQKKHNQTPKGRAKAIRAAQAYKEAHHEKYLAHKAVQQKVSRGTIVKPEKCESCSIEGLQLEGHHYNGYLGVHRFEVRWLCRKCHRKMHS